MELVLAAISPADLDAVRRQPDLLAPIFDGGAGVFTADYGTLEAEAATMTTKAWFDTAVNGTEPLGYDEFTYGPAFALDVADVRAVAAGLVAEGWDAASNPGGTGEQDVDATARSLGAAAGWDPEEFQTYVPMLAATWDGEFAVRLVRAVGAAGDWDDVTIDRLTAAVASVAPGQPRPAGTLASFFAAAARDGKAVVGGIAEAPPPAAT
jgi:hypothetical protein